MSEVLRVQLERLATGAHAHTANKANTYMRVMEDYVSGKRKGQASPESHAKQLAEFEVLINNALYRDEWAQLEKRMRGWF